MIHGYDLRRNTASGQLIARRSPVPHSTEHGPDSGLCMVPVHGFETEASGTAQYNRYHEQSNLDARYGATSHGGGAPAARGDAAVR